MNQTMQHGAGNWPAAIPGPGTRDLSESKLYTIVRRRDAAYDGQFFYAVATTIRGMKRYVADAKPGFPDRVELRDAEPGETLLLLNYIHQPADTPYRASHAIFVREGAQTSYDETDRIPEPLRSRQISLRAFDADHMMVGADLFDGQVLEEGIARLFADPKDSYLQAHYASRGCYAARIERA